MKEEEKQNRLNIFIIWIITGVLAVLTGLLIVLFISFSKTLSRTAADSTYEKYYVMIVDDPGSSFWKSVYSSALLAAKEQNAYVEMISDNLSREYSQTELMEIAISSGADGIIVTSAEAEGMTELINKAYDEGIPVITLMNDNTQSERLSFVGIGNYNLGTEYGKLLLEMVKNRLFLHSTIDVTVLLDAGSEDSGQNVLAAAIQDAVKKDKAENPGTHKPIEISLIAVDASNNFSVEESVRKLFVSGQDNIPDIVVCLNENDTNSLYQAVVDYNQVGLVNILGYYDSEAILKGIERDVIYATISIDTDQMGRYCIDALTEYYETGNANQYYTADGYVINKQNIGEYRKGGADEE
ncbi:MAG: substrate-binding domain-containing protein [Lachnospiraceae bacterium]|nr:substrate-binding domain-containing protein [Lachnospiraceae bacterium]